VVLTIGIYAANTDDAQSKEIREAVRKLVAGYPDIRQMHGFYADTKENTVSFDLIFDYQAKKTKLCRRKSPTPFQVHILTTASISTLTVTSQNNKVGGT